MVTRSPGGDPTAWPASHPFGQNWTRRLLSSELAEERRPGSDHFPQVWRSQDGEANRLAYRRVMLGELLLHGQETTAIQGNRIAHSWTIKGRTPIGHRNHPDHGSPLGTRAPAQRSERA
jgi:hypothetical protein